MLLIPLNGLLAPATNFHSLKLFIEFIYHLGYLQTAGVTPGPVVTSDGALPEPQLACFIPDVKEVHISGLHSTVKIQPHN